MALRIEAKSSRGCPTVSSTGQEAGQRIVAGFFIETHPDPDNAPSDGPNMIPLNEMSDLLDTLMEFDGIAKARPVSIG